MDPFKNPFSPGAGSPPSELVGRDPILEQAKILLGRVKQRRSEKSMLLTGLRGVGKTVLLNEIEHMAREEGYRTVFIEAAENKALGVLIAPFLRNLLFDRIFSHLHEFLEFLPASYRNRTCQRIHHFLDVLCQVHSHAWKNLLKHLQPIV